MLIQHYLEVFLSEFNSLLHNERDNGNNWSTVVGVRVYQFVNFTDLARMYMLVSRLSEDRGREELQTRFEAHIYSQGVAAVEKCGESAQNVSGRSL